MFAFLNPVTLFAGDAGGGDGGQAVTDPAAQGSTDPQGAGGATEQAANEQFWGLFPDVPEQQRLMLEPHLKNVQAHVTRLEQQIAPFKSVIDSGLDAPTLNGLVGFSQRFEADPLGVWLEMGAALQDPERNGGQPVVHDSLDFEILGKIARGEDVDDVGTQVPDPTQMPGQQQGAIPPEVLAHIQAQQQEIDQLKQRYDADKSQAQSRAQEQLLVRQMGNIRTALEGEGFPKERLTDDMIRSAIIVSKGNVAQAQKMLSELRAAAVEGGIQPAPKAGALKLENGTPKVPDQPAGRKPRDGFEANRAGATDFLKRANKAAAQS